MRKCRQKLHTPVIPCHRLPIGSRGRRGKTFNFQIKFHVFKLLYLNEPVNFLDESTFVAESEQRPFVMSVTKTSSGLTLIFHLSSKGNSPSERILMNNRSTKRSCFCFMNPAHSNTGHNSYFGFS